MTRPILTEKLSRSEFETYYYLKVELTDFCRRSGLPVSGSKAQLTQRIAVYLETGQKLTAIARQTKKAAVRALTPASIIETPFVCSQNHRAFFKEQLGPRFTFNAAFQNWLKEHSGQTYQTALTAYQEIVSRQKKQKPPIGRQFEYNTYIRDFFAANQGKDLQQAIRCWQFKKSRPGHNRYEAADLQALAT